MAIGGSQKYTAGYRYYMSMHMGIARGPIDQIIEIRVGDRTAWKGQIDETNDVIQIAAPNLFGGDESEGGIEGSLRVMMGHQAQNVSPSIKTLMKGRVPDFRGVCTLFFDGMIAAMNPYPKAWKMRVRRAREGWDGAVWRPDLAVIWLDDNKIRAMNPAHILYECATNRDWGRGFPRTRLDDVSWTQAATTLFNEDMGLCIRYNRQDGLDSFIQTVLDHIGGSIYTDRETGLITLKLLRADYDPNALPLFDYNSGLLAIEDGDTAARDKAVNEVIVKFHSPINNEDGEVRAQNLASIQTLGAINSVTTDYSGLPTLRLASRVAQRDLRINTASGQRFKLKLDRRAWRIYPGAPFRISALDRGISNLVLRAGLVREGDPTSGEITVDAVIDVFGLPAAAFVDRETGQWEPPDTSTSIVAERLIREATYHDLVGVMSATELAALDPMSGMIATFGVKPTALSMGYAIMSKTATEVYAERANGAFVPSLLLAGNVTPYQTSIAFNSPSELGLVTLGDLMEVDTELMRVDAITLNEDGASGTLTVLRGCIDTIPGAHVSGSRGFFTGQILGTDQREYASSEQVSVKLITITSSSRLDPNLAPIDTVSIQARQGRPYPPGAVRINGQNLYDVTSVNGTMTLTWAHRDRKLQADNVIDHWSGSIGPETGTTYRIRVYAANGDLIQTFSDISGTSFEIPTAITGSNLRFELESVRDNLASVQKYVVTLNRTSG